MTYVDYRRPLRWWRWRYAVWVAVGLLFAFLLGAASGDYGGAGEVGGVIIVGLEAAYQWLQRQTRA